MATISHFNEGAAIVYVIGIGIGIGFCISNGIHFLLQFEILSLTEILLIPSCASKE